MKNTAYKFNKRRRIFPAFLLVSVLIGIGFLINHTILAESGNNKLRIQKKDNTPNGFAAPRDSAPAANIGERTSVWLKLQEGRSLDTTFYGNDSAISALRSNLAEPLSQVSADFNLDGYADLVGGFRNGAGGGLIIIHRANSQAFAPTDEQVFADLQRGIFPAAFEKDAFVTEVPTAPDFIVTGKFSLDSAADVVFASRGGHSIYLMTSDNKGGFNQPQEIPVGGEITALASQRLDYSGAFDGIVAAVDNGKSASLLVFSSNKDLMNTAPRAVEVESAVSSITLAKRESSSDGVELFGLSNGKLFTIADIGKANSKINSIDLPYRAVDFAVGNFIADRRGKNEIAVLADGGNVNYLTDGTLDTRPLTKEEVGEHLRRYGRRSIPFKTADAPENWAESESYQRGVYAARSNSTGLLRKAYLTGYETEDLLIVNQQSKSIEILFKEPNHSKNRTSFTGETKIQTIDFAGTPETVLPMRLNVMGQQGFVVYDKETIEPKTVMLAPNAVYNVSKTADTNDGTCDADCSVREAIRASNLGAGADIINIPNNTHQITRTGTDDNTAINGDLDILDAVAITGAGSAGTIVQAGATAGSGIDKVFSVNPGLTLSFATSMTGLTVRFGNNTVDGFGGGMDWDAGTTGTLTVNNAVANQNTLNSVGIGGGGFLITSANTPGGGSATITNTTFSTNTATAAATAAAIGGGLYVQYTPLSMTNVIFNGNTSKNGGGGLYLESVTGSGASGSSTFSTLTFTNNTTTAAGTDGGGLLTLRGIVLNGVNVISNNTATRFGGGVSSSVISSSVTFNKVTMVGNSAPTNGGAIEVGTITTGNAFNMLYSRIVGNTSTSGFTGLVTRGGTATVENNWWGCNGGPGTAGCDTVGATAGSVDFNPWLQLRLTAGTTTPVVGQSTTLTASFLTNSAGTAIAASNLDVLIGLPVSWSASAGGTISGQQATIQSNGQATATYTASSTGAKTATAQVDNGPATVNLTVGQASTTTTITTDNPDASVRGQTITVTYTVVGQFGGTPTGNVTVSDGVNSCTGTVAAGSCTVALNTVGARTLTAMYAGDTNFTGSSDTEPHTVNAAATTTTITADTPDPSVRGQSITVTFTVTVNSPGAGTPTGNVTVSDGVNSCTGTVTAGSCTVALNTVGARTLTATYTGDTNFTASTSAGEPHTVNKANTTTTITADTPDPTNIGQTFTVTYTVTVSSPGTGTPTGNVTVSDGVNSCTGTVAAGQCSLALTTSGNRTLTATYASDANFNGSVSLGAAHTVLPPTAAAVTVGGRVKDQNGRGIANAVVTLSDQNGQEISIRTNSFGYYRFAEVAVGRTYIMSVRHKRYSFAPRVIAINDELQDTDFTAAD